MTELLLQANHLTCYRGSRLLFQDLTFSLHSGQLLQVVGANGSGKTSLLRLLTGVLQPQEGDILWQGSSIAQQRSDYCLDLLYLGHDKGVKQELTVIENLRYALRHERHSQADYYAAIAQMGLKGFEPYLCQQLSRGQRQRVALCYLLLSQARLWILDEPFAAIDAEGVIAIQEILLKQLERGAVILTTHQPLTLTHLPVTSLSLSEEEVML